MEDNKNQIQTRFFLALVLSLGVFMTWTFLFPPKKPDNANANTNAVVPQNSAANPQTAANSPAPNGEIAPVQNSAPDAISNQILTVKTPFYEMKFDSRGAVLSSLILLKNQTEKGEKYLFNGSSTKNEKFPLEMISAEASARRDLPLRIETGDKNFDTLLHDRNYQISGADGGDIVLRSGESRKIDFTLRDEANQAEVVKSLTLKGDGYVSDLVLKITRNGQTMPTAKLQIGANIGDQGIKHYNLYSVQPEAVAVVAGNQERQRGVDIAPKINETGRKSIPGAIDFGGVGDTYFAMAAIPAAATEGLEVQSTAYEYKLPEPSKTLWQNIFGGSTETEIRHLTSALVPINADGNSVTKIYTGTKDHYLLVETSEKISGEIGRTVDLDNFINYYGWLSWLVKPLAIPILWTINLINTFTNSFGWAILVFTLLFYSLLFPLRWYQSRSFKKSAKNAPRMKELQDRLKEMQAKNIPIDDPRMRELQMEQLKLTKDMIPIGGCLPLLLQMPFLFALLAAITISLDFRQTPFLYLPDLAGGDPYHILEFMFAGSMALIMLFAPTAPAMTDEQRMQQKMMVYMMPLMMLWVMWGSPAGLLIYWLAGNIITFGQQMLINRINKSDDDPPKTSETKRTMSKKELKALSVNP